MERIEFEDALVVEPAKVSILDEFPVGAEIDFDGDVVPEGWEEIEGDFITSESLRGNVVIGKLGIEWGQIDITSGETGTSGQGTTIYSGYETLTFKNIYKNTPQIITSWRGYYLNQISTYSNNTNKTSSRIGALMSSASSTRTVAYLVVGEVE